jgi:hypothetical protein
MSVKPQILKIMMSKKSGLAENSYITRYTGFLKKIIGCKFETT